MNTTIQLHLEEKTNYLASTAKAAPFFLHDESVRGGNNFFQRFPPCNYNLKANSWATLMSSTSIYDEFLK